MRWPSWLELKQCKFEAFDELGHEREIKSVDRVAGKVVVRISEEGGIGNHERWQTSVPEGGVIAQARLGQESSIERKKERLDR